MILKTERIAAAAVYEGVIISLPPPARHHTILYSLNHALGSHLIGPNQQGFVTSTGRYVNRTEAYYIAERAGQLLPRPADGYQGNELYSEDLW